MKGIQKTGQTKDDMKEAGRSEIADFISHVVSHGNVAHLIRVCAVSQDEISVVVESAGAASGDASRVTVLPLSQFDSNVDLPLLDDELLRDCAIVCTGEFEQIACPNVLATLLAKVERKCRWIFISAKDRVRTRGIAAAMQEQADPVSGWTAEEFGRVLTTSGFRPNFFIGYASGDREDLSKRSVLVIAGREAIVDKPISAVHVAAILNVFNEADVLEETITHLAQQGVEVHIFDDWSTDGSYEIAQKLLQESRCKAVSRTFDTPSDQYEWARLLRNTEQYAASLDADWVLHCDADELRVSPWPHLSLAEAITCVDAMGYNAVDFTVINFLYTHASESSNASGLERFKYFDFGRQRPDFLQIKAWRKQATPVDLASSGGHEARFDDRRVFPLKFLLRHYPLRSQQQAEKKLFSDRIPRIRRERSEKGWHVHYNHYEKVGFVLPWREDELLPYETPRFNEEFLIERLSGVGLGQVEQIFPSSDTLYKLMESIPSPGEGPRPDSAALASRGEELERWLAGHLQGKVQALRVAPPDEWDRTINFCFGGDAYRYTLHGWSAAETEGTWTDGHGAAIALPRLAAAGARRGRVVVEAGPFLIPGQAFQAVELRLNGQPVAHWEIDRTSQWSAEFDIAQVSGGNEVVMEFSFADPHSPRDLGLSADPRRLGLCVRSIAVSCEPLNTTEGES